MKTWTIALLCLPLAAAACAKEQCTVAKTSPLVTTTRTITRTETNGVQGGNKNASVELTKLEVSDEIAKRCDLPVAHFPFDSAAINGDAKAALDKLADCFSKGALAGQTMKIIGHTDPRGTVDYNFGLGQRRAGSVASYLEKRGLAYNKIETSSLGELEAVGTTEDGYAKDRKVEILLAKQVILPTQGESSTKTETKTTTH